MSKKFIILIILFVLLLLSIIFTTALYFYNEQQYSIYEKGIYFREYTGYIATDGDAELELYYYNVKQEDNNFINGDISMSSNTSLDTIMVTSKSINMVSETKLYALYCLTVRFQLDELSEFTVSSIVFNYEGSQKTFDIGDLRFEKIDYPIDSNSNITLGFPLMFGNDRKTFLDIQNNEDFSITINNISLGIENNFEEYNLVFGASKRYTIDCNTYFGESSNDIVVVQGALIYTKNGVTYVLFIDYSTIYDPFSNLDVIEFLRSVNNENND